MQNRHTLTIRRKTILRTILRKLRAAHLLSCIILVSCGSNPTQDQSTVQEAPQLSLEDIPAQLESASAAAPEEKKRILVSVVNTLLQFGEVDWARNTFNQLRSAQFPSGESLTYYTLAGKLAMAEGQLLLAKRYLWHSAVGQYREVATPPQQAALHELRSSLLFDLGEYRQSIAERLVLDTLLESNSDQRGLNQDILWQTLMELSLLDLQQESQMQTDTIPQGWYTLAALSKDNQTNIRSQLEALERWALYWPEHPASLRMPADLQLLKQLADEQPRHIALLLPLSGKYAKAAQAIRDGILAAYYDAKSHDENPPELRIYDTASQGINSLYENAINSGAELVIGPLEKERIVELALNPELPVPTLALNRIETAIQEPEKLYQFGLAPEDEAAQVAAQAWRDGHRRAMILAPATDRGDRSVESFSQAWLALGGKIISDDRYKGQKTYSSLVKSAVGVAESEARKKRLRRLLGTAIEFEPRRRQDVDFIFMHGYASQARQLKPILAFHYAGDIPVYSISDVYNGQDDAKMNRDLNNIQFTTLPWFFENNLAEKSAVEAHFSHSQFLYALGVDAFHLHPRLKQLQEFKKAHFYGATGNLSMDENRKIKREQTWAKFVNGKAIAIQGIEKDEDI